MENKKTMPEWLHFYMLEHQKNNYARWPSLSHSTASKISRLTKNKSLVFRTSDKKTEINTNANLKKIFKKVMKNECI